MTLDLTEFVWIWNQTQHLSTPKHHRRMCRYLKDAWDCRQNSLLMAFRNSGKSTLVGLFCAWVLKENPDCRILILSADYELAKKMVRNIKRIIERHPLTASLKPAQKDQWASDRFTVCRPGELRDPSVLARGLGANITGCRADLIVCDDVEVPKTCDTPAKRADLRQKLSELDFVLVPGGMTLYVGTPHAFETIYDPAPGGFLADFNVLKLPIFTKDGSSWWPERFSMDKIKAIQTRSGPAKFASQMLLQPCRLTEGRLDTDKLCWYTGALDYRETNQTAELRIMNTRMTGVSCWWDPSFGKPEKGDSSVIACVFQDNDGFYYMHDVAYLTVDNSDESAARQCDQVADFVDRNHIPAVHIETNGLGKFLPEILKRTLARRHLRCAVLPEVSRTQKEQRILDAFDAILSNRALRVNESVKRTPFYTEMRDWVPFSKSKDDGIDAVAGCLLSVPVRLPRCFVQPIQKPDWRFYQE